MLKLYNRIPKFTTPILSSFCRLGNSQQNIPLSCAISKQNNPVQKSYVRTTFQTENNTNALYSKHCPNHEKTGILHLSQYTRFNLFPQFNGHPTSVAFIASYAHLPKMNVPSFNSTYLVYELLSSEPLRQLLSLPP